MQLEDHIGDIIRKGRLHKGVSSAAAAAAAGLAPNEFARFEETGVSPHPLRFDALSRALDLDAAKLAAIAGGWLPRPAVLDPWRRLRVVVTAGAGMTVNAFVVWDEATREAALFDTGFDADPIRELVRAEGLELGHIFITHGHGDHVGALPELRRQFPATRVHCGSRSAPLEDRNQPGESVAVGRLRVSHRETPGHSADGVTYIVEHWPGNAPRVALVGDALFAGSMGRAAERAAGARDKIRDRILSLPGDTLLCPGHGPLSTVAEEKEHNPFF